MCVHSVFSVSQQKELESMQMAWDLQDCKDSLNSSLEKTHSWETWFTTNYTEQIRAWKEDNTSRNMEITRLRDQVVRLTNESEQLTQSYASNVSIIQNLCEGNYSNYSLIVKDLQHRLNESEALVLESVSEEREFQTEQCNEKIEGCTSEKDRLNFTLQLLTLEKNNALDRIIHLEDERRQLRSELNEVQTSLAIYTEACDNTTEGGDGGIEHRQSRDDSGRRSSSNPLRRQLSACQRLLGFERNLLDVTQNELQKGNVHFVNYRVLYE